MNGYFKGFYFKQQNKENTTALIPSYHIGVNGIRTAQIQVVTEQGAAAAEYPNYKEDQRKQYLKIGNSFFSSRKIVLDIHTNQLDATGKLYFDNLVAPGYDIMGPFRFVPFLECRHSVISMLHRVSGELLVNGCAYHYQNSAGYIEGDRGRNFPSEYLWTQCCWHDGKTNSLMLSAADIPFGGFHFTGIIGLLYWHGRQYRLATYLGAKAEIQNQSVRIRQGDYVFTAQLLHSRPLALQAPKGGVMARSIDESPACTAAYRFEKNGRKIFEFMSTHASFEYEYHQ